MGVLGLSRLIIDLAPTAVIQNEVRNYFGRKVAIDASMSLYQFLIAVRINGAQLTDASGGTTSHLMGTFYRTIHLVENGITPIYVFDGKAPEMKSAELSKRVEKRVKAQNELKHAKAAGDIENINKLNRRLVKVTEVHTQQCKDLLKLMGVPYIDAPCEAEAQCAAMVKAGRVYGTATEDMDALTFGSSILLRNMTSSGTHKLPIREFHLSTVLKELGFSHEEFIDLCILLGCDYCEKIHGIGPKRAMILLKKHRNIETILEKIDQKKYHVPENWSFKEARLLFLQPEVEDPEFVELKLSDPDEDGLVKYLCGNMNFNEDRVRRGAKKLCKG